MADIDKNILITPNKSQPTVFPKIEFTGFDNNPITLSVLDDGTLSFSGSSGQLFSVSDSLAGTIFSVNDISGIPSIEVEDDGTVRLAEFAGNVGIGIVTPTEKLDVVGNIAVSGTVDGRDVSVDGTKLDTIASSANNYAHPTGDGNLHVPATSTGNNGKFLMAGATAGALSWGTPTDTDTVYSHPTGGNGLTAQSGATVVSSITVNSLGHTTAVGTRELTAANIGAAASSHTHSYLPSVGGSLTGSVSYNDVSRYWLNTATNWGIYWDTTNNSIEFHAAGVDKFNFDLDTGIATATTWVGSLSGNASTATWADTVDVNASNDGGNEYALVWHSGDTVYSSSYFTIHRDQKRLTTPVLKTAKVVGTESTGATEKFEISWNDSAESIDFIFR